MNRLVAFYQSSIGKKITMSLTGLFLCTFLVEHLVGNLLLFVGDGGESFDAYSEFMAGNFVIRTIEFVLLFGFLGHIVSGYLVWRKNRTSRSTDYEVYRLNENSPIWSRNTMLTGSIVFIFLVIHLRTFFLPLRFDDPTPSPYFLVVQAFTNGWYCAFYVFALILLAYHLRHGFQAAMQTLGLRNSRYEGLINAIGAIFWLLIPLGFASMPVYFYFFHTMSNAAMALGAL